MNLCLLEKFKWKWNLFKEISSYNALSEKSEYRSEQKSVLFHNQSSCFQRVCNQPFATIPFGKVHAIRLYPYTCIDHCLHDWFKWFLGSCCSEPKNPSVTFLCKAVPLDLFCLICQPDNYPRGKLTIMGLEVPIEGWEGSSSLLYLSNPWKAISLRKKLQSIDTISLRGKIHANYCPGQLNNQDNW